VTGIGAERRLHFCKAFDSCIFSRLKIPGCDGAGLELLRRCEKARKSCVQQGVQLDTETVRHDGETGLHYKHENPDRLLLAAIILFAAGCLPAQVQLPDTPAAHQLSGWLAAFNSGDKATFLAFLQKNYPLARERLTAKWVSASKPAV